MTSHVGVVIIGRNEGQRLVNCLTSIATQADDIVYVDSGSTDGSTTVAEKFGALVVTLDPTHPFTAARARNSGFAALIKAKPSTRFVQFIDGDCELVTGWLEIAHAYISQHGNVAIVCGRRHERFPGASLYNRLCDIEWDTPIGLAKACGGDSMVRVEALEKVNGFSSQLIAGEEPELCVRLRKQGWKIWRLDAEMTRHDANIMQLSQWWIRAVRSGHAYAEVFCLHRHSGLGVYRREMARIIFWAGIVPLIIGVGGLFQFSLLEATLVYPLEICWIAWRRGVTRRESWMYAFFMTLGKFAEFQGIIKYFWRRLRGYGVELIEYK